MARSTKTTMSWDSIFFNSPEQKVLRYLFGSRETSYSLRVLVSKLKGVRGLGGIQGLEKILTEMEEVGMVTFIDNRRGIRIVDEHPTTVVGRKLWALCELETLYAQLKEISYKGILLSVGQGEIELYVVSESPEEIQRLTEQHPMGKMVLLTIHPRAQFEALSKKDPKFYQLVSQGVLIWGGLW